jgi:hypothetical protein
MIMPFLPSRMKYWNELAANRIKDFSFGVFMAITTRTRQRQIASARLTASTARLDMFHRKGLSRKARLTQTIFTAFSCLFYYLLSQSRRNAFFTHKQEDEYPILS